MCREGVYGDAWGCIGHQWGVLVRPRGYGRPSAANDAGVHGRRVLSMQGKCTWATTKEKTDVEAPGEEITLNNHANVQILNRFMGPLLCPCVFSDPSDVSALRRPPKGCCILVPPRPSSWWHSCRQQRHLSTQTAGARRSGGRRDHPEAPLHQICGDNLTTPSQR